MITKLRLLLVVDWYSNLLVLFRFAQIHTFIKTCQCQ